MAYRLHLFPSLFFLVLGLGLQIPVTRWVLDRSPRRALVLAASFASGILLCLGYLFEFERVLHYASARMVCWVQFASLFWTVSLVGFFLATLSWGGASAFRPERRRFLQATGAALCAAPVVGTGFGILKRDQFQVSETDVPIHDLPKDLQGLRIVQITDIHLSPFLSEKEFARAIDMANEVRAPLALVTGDLISRNGDPLDACLRQLARLRAEAGVLGCLGNHEVYTRSEDYVTEIGRRIGIEFLRQQARVLRFGESSINFAGVDYQRMHSEYLEGAEQLVATGMVNVLLSHNPDVFPVAAEKGYDLTIAGHTHGGQVTFELLHQNMSIPRYFTPYVRGLYRELDSSVYVSNGIGTIGVPVRVGAPPEISVLRLCAI